MRVISGIFKGKSITFLKSKITRPLKDSVKENIFNIINHSNLLKIEIEEANILDLYSGTGSFGIECISRGAEKVTFVEHDINAGNILKDNLINLSIIKKSQIHLNKIELFLAKDINEKFHILFFDPPFADINFLQNLEIIKKVKIFRKNHLVVIHREEKSNDKFKDLLKITDIKKYGRSKIFFGVFN